MRLFKLHKETFQSLWPPSVHRSIRKWWVALPANRRQLMREWAWQRRWQLVAVAGVAMVILVLLLMTHLDESPVTGRTRLLVFSRQNYMELAALTSEQVREGGEGANIMMVVMCLEGVYRMTTDHLITNHAFHIHIYIFVIYVTLTDVVPV